MQSPPQGVEGEQERLGRRPHDEHGHERTWPQQKHLGFGAEREGAAAAEDERHMQRRHDVHHMRQEDEVRHLLVLSCMHHLDELTSLGKNLNCVSNFDIRTGLHVLEHEVCSADIIIVHWKDQNR